MVERMVQDIINIAAIHSLSGTMEFSESPLLAAEMAAVDEINKSGGLLGREIRLIYKDGASDAARFGHLVNKLINQFGPLSIFGCWTSASRKVVRQVVESGSSLLWYPLQYEGLEESRSIVYTGMLPNQQIEPILNRLIGSGRRNIIFVGSDYVFPRVAGQFVKTLLPSYNGKLIEEIYIPLGERNLSWLINRIIELNPDALINGINGDSNVAFFRALKNAGITSGEIPVYSLSLSEVELSLDPEAMAGHFACWSYYSTLNTPESREFSDKMKNTTSGGIPLSDPVATAYSQIYLWKNAVESNNTFDPVILSNNIEDVVYNNGPLGPLKICSNRHAAHKPLIAVATVDGVFQIVDDSSGSIEPEPWMGIGKTDLRRKDFIRAALEAYPEVLHNAWQERLNIEIFKQNIQKERRTEKEYLIQERKNSELGRMLGVIAHQWKQPLNSLAIIVADIEDAYKFGALDEDYINGFVKEAQEVILFLSDTVDDFRNYYLPGKETQHFFPVEAIESTFRILLPRFLTSGIQVKIELDSIAGLEVSGGRNEFRQVIMNLINNAREACLQRISEEPGISTRTIHIIGYKKDSTVEIIIEDDGGGIPDAMSEHLFHAFYTTKKSSGSGLGLHLARSIIEDHMKGSLNGENRGQGARFVIRLPVSKDSSVNLE